MQPTIERKHLIEAAQQLINTSHLLIEAAAGYGKTVRLTQLLNYLPMAQYIRLTVDDNDLSVLQDRLNRSAAHILLFDDAHFFHGVFCSLRVVLCGTSSAEELGGPSFGARSIP